MNKNRKAGPVTLALGMILFGIILLISNFSGTGIFAVTLKYWPLLLIGLGIEFFIRSYLNSKKEDSETRFHFPTLIIILFIAFGGFAGQQVTGILQNQDLNEAITEAVAGTKYSYKHEYKSNPITAAPGTKIRIDDLGGQVDLVPGEGDQIYVEAEITGWGPTREDARSRAEEFSVNISEGGVINISSPPDIYMGDYKRTPFVKYRVVIPPKVKLAVSGGSGGIRADNLEADIEINMEHGELSLAGITGDVSVNGAYGRITVKDITGNLNVSSNSGDINVSDVSGDMRIVMENGRIEVAGSDPMTAKSYITNQNGSTVVRIPEKSDVSVIAETEHGSISGSLDLNIEKSQSTPENAGLGSKGTAVLGSGRGLISVTSDNGSIIIDN